MKYSEIIQFTDEELVEKLGILKQEHMNLRFQVKLMTEGANANNLSKIRRNVAKIKTEMTKRSSKNKKNG